MAQQLVAQTKLREAQLQLRRLVQDEPRDLQAHLALADVDGLLADPLATERELQAAEGLGATAELVRPKLADAYLKLRRFTDALALLSIEEAPPGELAHVLLLRGIAQIGLADVTAAEASLKAIEESAPAGPEAPSLRARLALLERDYGTAEAMVDQTLARAPGDVDALLMKIQLRSFAGDDAGATVAAGQAVQLYPWSRSARLSRADLLMKAGRDQEAEQDVSAVLANYPHSADAIYLRAVLKARAGQYSEAANGFVHLYPVIQQYPRALYFQAVIAAMDGKPETTVALARRYVAQAPDDSEGVVLLARAQITAGRPNDAVETLRQAGAESGDVSMLDLLGSAYALAGDMPSAQHAYERAAALDPDDPRVLTHLTLSKMQATALLDTISALRDVHPEQAEAALERLRDETGETEPVGILEGLIRLQRLDLAGAEAAFSSVLTRFPDSIDARLNLADVLARQGRTGDAEAMFGEVLQRQPHNRPALHAYVHLMLRDKHGERAIGVVEHASEQEPGEDQLRILLADVLVQAANPARAIEVLANLRNRVGPSAPILAALARAQLASGLMAETKDTLEQLLTLTPGDLGARRLLVDLLTEAGDLDEAEASMRQAIAARPDNLDLMAAMVRLAVQKGGLAHGLDMARTLEAETAGRDTGTMLAGDAYMQAGQYADAARTYAADPASLSSFLRLARLAKAYAKAGNPDEATRRLTAWLSGHPGDAEASALLADLDLRAGRMEDAAQHLQTVVVQRPYDTIAMNNLALIYSKNHDPRALPLAQTAHSSDPSDHTADTLGWIMLQDGNIDAALPLLEEAHRKAPANGTIAYHLAAATDRLGQTERATSLLRESLASATVFDGREAAKSLLVRLDASPVGTN